MSVSGWMGCGDAPPSRARVIAMQVCAATPSPSSSSSWWLWWSGCALAGPLRPGARQPRPARVLAMDSGAAIHAPASLADDAAAALSRGLGMREGDPRGSDLLGASQECRPRGATLAARGRRERTPRRRTLGASRSQRPVRGAGARSCGSPRWRPGGGIGGCSEVLSIPASPGAATAACSFLHPKAAAHALLEEGSASRPRGRLSRAPFGRAVLTKL
eukprot:scaffold442_cov397-Prasinococcus_capsulatus_cf.AAC.8